MGYQPSEATKNLQKLLETVEQKQAEYDRLKGAALSADVENDRIIIAMNKTTTEGFAALARERQASVDAFDARERAIQEEHKKALQRLGLEHAMKTEARDKAKIALDQTKTQLRAELAKAGALAEGLK